MEIAAEAPDALAPGAKAGPWIVERELGRGGMGAVYAVVHEDIGKRAALKVMHRRLVSGSSAERILLEARVVNQVGHPNIVDIFETGTLADGRPYIVMERLDGVPLGQRCDEGKILPDQVISILLQVCDALIAAHAAGIVHRDLKVDNVFLLDNPEDPSSPRVKLLDWGIAKVISADPHHTIEGQLVGTPQYLAPEQARGAAVSPATDVYSLGVMAYELFLEQLPFEAETSAEIMAMHLRVPPPPPSELWPDIPPRLETVMLAMLAKDPDGRPSMLAVAHTLELVRGDLQARCPALAGDSAPVSATPAPELPHAVRWISAPGLAPTEPAGAQVRRRRWQVAVGALAVIASATMFLLTRDGEPASANAAQAVVAPEQVSEPAPAAELPAPPPAPAAAAAEQLAVVQPAPAPAPVAPAPAPVHAAAAPRVHHAAFKPHRHRAKPRRDADRDPDGTVDPYQ
ncbi:MAG: serine/threonine-protein kinase [Acidobacteriota bacterium]